jgi:hypothetical protein
MTKKEIIEALGQFNDSDQIAVRGDPHLYPSDFAGICGKGQEYMIYKCVLPSGHAGECYCGCKDVYFIPDESNNALCVKVESTPAATDR